jgi:hypothetical protein
MRLQNSSVVDPSEYDLQGVSDPAIELRRHKNPEFEVIGALHAQQDWKQHVGPLQEPYRGCFSPHGNFMAVAVPECIPERLEISHMRMSLLFFTMVSIVSFFLSFLHLTICHQTEDISMNHRYRGCR